MSWSAVVPVVVSLAGVIVGSLGTLASQFLATRRDVQRDAAAVERDVRAERKEAIVGFFSSTQHVEMLIATLDAGDKPDRQLIYERVHDMWLALKIVGLVASADFAEAATGYCNALQRRIRGDTAAGDAAKTDTRRAATAAARRDMQRR